jgi:hypothetical protein
MSHRFDYTTLLTKLPPGVEPGHDGLVIEMTASQPGSEVRTNLLML